MRRSLYLLAHIVILSSACKAGALTIVPTGDSLTNGYSELLSTKFTAAGMTDITISKVAQGGLTAQMYVGNDPYMVDPLTTADFSAAVLAADPDVIMLMLGTNNAQRLTWDPNSFQFYKTCMTDVFDQYSAFVNGRGNNPLVLLASLPPITQLSDRYAVAEPAIENDFNPWLQQQAQERGFVFVDIFAAITAQEGWQDWCNDGIHYWGPMVNGVWQRTGQHLMAQEFVNATVAAMPEPSSLALLAVGLACVRRRRR